MREASVERWSRGSSPLHAVDARAKLGALIALLIAIGTTPAGMPWTYGADFVLILMAMAAARLPMLAILSRAALVLPFSAVFAALMWAAGDSRAALVVVAKSFLSVLAAVTLAASTPWPRLLDALALLRVPRALVLVIQFLGRYLFVLAGQAVCMRLAAESRMGLRSSRAIGFHAASGAIGVLFARSWERADGIYQAMLARGFRGRFPSPAAMPFHPRDAAFLSLSVGAILAIRLGL